MGSSSEYFFWLVLLWTWNAAVFATGDPSITEDPSNAIPVSRGAVNPLWTAGRTDAIEGSGAIGSIVPKIPGLDVTCPVPAKTKYKPGTKCANGKPAPKPFKQSKVDDIRLPWFHPANQESIKHVRMVEQKCSLSCTSGICYYSMNTFTFTCETEPKKKRTKDYKNSLKAFKEIRKFYDDSMKLEVGKICSRGPRRGMEYDPNLVTRDDLAAAKWFVETAGKAGVEKMEKELNVYCKRGDCELVLSKGVFLCGGRGQRLQSSMILLLVILIVPFFEL